MVKAWCEVSGVDLEVKTVDMVLKLHRPDLKSTNYSFDIANEELWLPMCRVACFGAFTMGAATGAIHSS